jgi:hypothetical protein
MDQDRVHDAEHRAVGADPQGQRRDDDQAEDPLLPQHADGEPEVLEEAHVGPRLARRVPARRSRFFNELRRPAAPLLGRASRSRDGRETRRMT